MVETMARPQARRPSTPSAASGGVPELPLTRAFEAQQAEAAPEAEPEAVDAAPDEEWEEPAHYEYRTVPRRGFLKKALVGAVVVVGLMVGIHALDSHNALGPPSNPNVPGVVQIDPGAQQPAVPKQAPNLEVQLSAQNGGDQGVFLQVKINNHSQINAVNPSLQVMTATGPVPVNGTTASAADGKTLPLPTLPAFTGQVTEDITVPVGAIQGPFWIEVRANNGQLNVAPVQHLVYKPPSSPLAGDGGYVPVGTPGTGPAAAGAQAPAQAPSLKQELTAQSGGSSQTFVQLTLRNTGTTDAVDPTVQLVDQTSGPVTLTGSTGTTSTSGTKADLATIPAGGSADVSFVVSGHLRGPFWAVVRANNGLADAQPAPQLRWKAPSGPLAGDGGYVAAGERSSSQLGY